MSDPQKPRQPIRGVSVAASYRDNSSEDEAFSNNPLVMALPAEWEWDGEQTPIVDKLTTYFLIDRDTLAKLSTARRILHLTKFKLQFFQVLGRHRDLERSISLALRFGYLGRNPAQPRYRRNLHDKLATFAETEPVFVSPANLGFALLGSPGLGKTTSLARILRLYPQVIFHQGPEFHHTQVTWLFLTCPHDKSTRSLCLLFFQEIDALLGTNLHREYFGENESSLIAGMATEAANLSLGLLAIDEIQFLNAAKSGGKSDLLKFFVQLENTLGIPIVLVGTHKATKLIAGCPHQARRSVGIGGQTWKPLSIDDSEWEVFLEAMWGHQFLKNHSELTPELRLAMHEETQGLFNYAVDLFYFAQLDAINEGTEVITADSVRFAARRHMEYNRPYINALRSGDQLYAEILEDIVACDYEQHGDFFESELLLPPVRFERGRGKELESKPARQINHTSTASGEIPSFQPPVPVAQADATAPPVPKRRKRRLQGYPAGSIMAICDEAASLQNIAPYEALKNAGLIRSLAEFLPVDAVA